MEYKSPIKTCNLPFRSSLTLTVNADTILMFNVTALRDNLHSEFKFSG